MKEVMVEVLEDYKKELLVLTETNRKHIFELRDTMKELTKACMMMEERLTMLENRSGFPQVPRTVTLDGDPDS